VRCESVTPASDIYVLGILLFELLSGCRPFALQGASAVEIERIICEQDLLPPSLALGRPEVTSIGQARLASQRGLQPQELPRRLRGNLDAIVMAAMRRDPQERYATAALLGKDIERHLFGEPIVAAAAGGGLQSFKRWVRGIGRALGMGGR
jgi:eukaryotic-like serine/threonine-protein kinase